MSEEGEGFLLPKDVSMLTGLKLQTIYAMLKRGDIEAIRTNPNGIRSGLWLITKQSFNKWLSGQTNKKEHVE